MSTDHIEEQSTQMQAPLHLGADLARIIEEQIGIIAQRQVYHTQLMFGVSGLGTDPVNARNAALTIANALRNDTPGIVKHALVNLGDAQLAQINDQATPFKFNAQVAGLLEGILLDTISEAYKGDAARRAEARAMLESLFVEANEEMQRKPKALLAFMAPGTGPNAHK